MLPACLLSGKAELAYAVDRQQFRFYEVFASELESFQDSIWVSAGSTNSNLRLFKSIMN